MSTKHTPEPLPVSKQYGGPNSYCRVIRLGPVEIHFTIGSGSDLESDAARQTESEANARLIATAPELLAELLAAHTIIRNALAVMTTDQKSKWGELNERDGVEGEGVTRANERAAAITKATGSN